jgi:hypothetical protein
MPKCVGNVKPAPLMLRTRFLRFGGGSGLLAMRLGVVGQPEAAALRRRGAAVAFDLKR